MGLGSLRNETYIKQSVEQFCCMRHKYGVTFNLIWQISFNVNFSNWSFNYRIRNQTYALLIETGLGARHIYTFKLHLKYLWGTLMHYSQDRLQRKLTKIFLRKHFFWVKSFNDLLNAVQIKSIEEYVSALIDRLISNNKAKTLQMALQNNFRLYKNLDLTRRVLYFDENYSQQEISWIFKVRCSLILLNRSCNMSESDAKHYTICNLCGKEYCQNISEY